MTSKAVIYASELWLVGSPDASDTKDSAKRIASELTALSDSGWARATYRGDEFSLTFSPIAAVGRRGKSRQFEQLNQKVFAVVSVEACVNVARWDAIVEGWGLESALMSGFEVYEQALATVVLSIRLAAPGELSVEHSFLAVRIDNTTIDGSMELLAPGLNGTPGKSLREVCTTAARLKWPDIRALPVKTVRQWLTALPGWEEGIGRDQAGRAVAALRRVIESPGPFGTLDLLWAMIGLEAVYTTRGAGLADQLLKNSEALLGPRLEFNKQFKQMYESRSRLIHGDQDLPLLHIGAFGDTRTPESVVEATHIAVAILIATIQELIVRDWTSLQFLVQVAGQRERSG